MAYNLSPRQISPPPNLKSSPIVKILLVNDSRVMRERIRSLLCHHKDIKIVGIATDSYSAIEQIEYLQPDLILLDLDLVNIDELDLAKIIDKKYPQIDVIVLTSHEDLSQINNSLLVGSLVHPISPCIKAYILKDNIELKVAQTIRSVYNSNPNLLAAKQTNVVELHRPIAENSLPDRSEASTSSQDDRYDFDDRLGSKFTGVVNTTFSKLNDWSNSAKELIDMMPLPWTRGLLYVLVGSLIIFLPWACLYRMDEIGTARGRLEFKGNTIKRESDLEGSVAVLKVYVKKGDPVKVGQVIMELDSKNVREQLYQSQLKINGEQQSLDRLLLIKNQVGLGTNAQQQQNQAQLLEKQSQIAQAQQSLASLEANIQRQISEKLAQLHQAEQTFSDRQSSYNLQKAEKLTQVRQAEQGVVDAQTNYILTQNRLKEAQNEARRYRKLYQAGAIPEIKAKEVASIALEKNQLFTQAGASLQQAKLRVKEQQENYQKLLQQTQSDIDQARLKLKEQQENYQGTIARYQADIAQAKLRLTEQQRNSQTLAKGGDIAILKTEQQLKEIESQIVTLKSQIDADRAKSKFFAKQLDKYIIKSNVDGTIFELPIEREGSVVQPKQLIAEIGSNSSGLVFKGEIPATQSESLRSTKTQKDVKLKFDEFPFESYDIVKGKLSWIAPNSKLSQVAPGSSMVSYDIQVQLDRSCIKHDRTCIPFKSGQPATAEIVIRNRRIIDFIVDPFRKLGK
jgi:hemolysin D